MTDLTPADLAGRLERTFPHPPADDLTAAIAMIKEHGADEGWDQAMCDEYIAREHAGLVAEVERLRAAISEMADDHGRPFADGVPDREGEAVAADLRRILAGDDNGGDHHG